MVNLDHCREPHRQPWRGIGAHPTRIYRTWRTAPCTTPRPGTLACSSTEGFCTIGAAWWLNPPFTHGRSALVLRICPAEARLAGINSVDASLQAGSRGITHFLHCSHVFAVSN